MQSLQRQNDALHAANAQLHDLLAQTSSLPALQAAIDTVSEGVILARSGEPLCLNPAALALLGIGPGQTPGDFPPDLLRYPSGQAVPPGALPWAVAARTLVPSQWRPYLAAHGFSHLPLGPPDLRPVEICASPVPGGAVAALRDVAARQQAGTQQKQTIKTRQTLAQAARVFACTTLPEALCQASAEAALALLPPDLRAGSRACLCTFAGQGQPLVLRAVAPAPAPKRPTRFAHTLPPTVEFDAQSPLLWKLYVDRETVSSADIHADPLFALARERALLHPSLGPPPAIASVLLLPLLPGAAATGHLLVTSPFPGAFPPDTQDALALLAALSASALARARGETLRHRRDDQLALLHQAALAACADTDPAVFVPILTRAAAAALDAAFCTLSPAAPAPLPARDRPLVFWGPPPPEYAAPTPTNSVPAPANSAPTPTNSAFASHCACTRVIASAARHGRPAAQVAVPNPALGECPWRPFGGQSGTHSALAVPLLGGDTALGVLAVFRHGSAPFSPQETSLAETFAALAARALARPAALAPPMPPPP